MLVWCSVVQCGALYKRRLDAGYIQLQKSLLHSTYKLSKYIMHRLQSQTTLLKRHISLF